MGLGALMRGSQPRTLAFRRGTQKGARADADAVSVVQDSAAEPQVDRCRAITLDTPCVCGHTRREHMGLRMEAKGRCLDCACQEFDEPDGAGKTEMMLARINQAIERVDRLIAAAATYLDSAHVDDVADGEHVEDRVGGFDRQL